MSKQWTSRFVLSSDPALQNFVFDLPEEWWSRPYEYAWAASFAEPNDVALDAASGIPHPLKFYLADRCQAVHAVDLDERILAPEAIREEVKSTYGVDLARHYLDGIDYRRASLTELPYADRTFDKVYCISVLEHMRDPLNKWPWLLAFRPLLGFLQPTIEQAMREFRRVLKEDGLMVLTFDHPRISLRYVEHLVQHLELEFAGPHDYAVPSDALLWDTRQLRCFRAVLRKRRA